MKFACLCIALLQAAVFAQLPDAEAAKWNDAAIRHQDAGRFQEAHEAYRRAIEAATSAALPADARLRLQVNLSSLYMEEGEYGAAAGVLAAAAKLASRVAPDSRELAGFHNAVAGLRLIEGNLSTAQKAYDQALAILDRPGVASGHELAGALQNVAGVEMRRGRYKEARRHLDRAIAMLDAESGPHRSELIRALTSLSTLEYLVRDWEGAARIAARAITLAETHYGTEHPAVAHVLQNYSLILERLDRAGEACKYRARAKGLLAGRKPAAAAVLDATEVAPAGLPVTVTTR